MQRKISVLERKNHNLEVTWKVGTRLAEPPHACPHPHCQPCTAHAVLVLLLSSSCCAPSSPCPQDQTWPLLQAPSCWLKACSHQHQPISEGFTPSFPSIGKTAGGDLWLNGPRTEEMQHHSTTHLAPTATNQHELLMF